MNRRQFLSTSTAASLAFAASSTFAAAEEKRTRVAVLGHTGRGDYGHGVHTMWLSLPETEIVGVADPDAKGLEANRKKLNGVPGFADYRALLSDLKPEIAAIAPRFADEHRDMALAAVAAGVRGIYMEKPFCRTPAEADEIVATCAKAGVKLAVAHRNRWHPALPVAKRAVDDGTLGELLEIRARGKEDPRGGALDLWVLGVHLFNLMHYFAGRPLACSAVMLKGSVPVTPADLVEGPEGVGPIGGDRLHARYEMERGVTAYFDSIKNAGVAAAGFGVQLIGTKGLIDLRIDTEPLAHHVPGNPFQPTKEARPWVPISSAGIGQPEPIADLKTQVAGHLTAARDLLAAVRENRNPLCSAEDARVTIEMVHAAFASHVHGGARLPLPLADRPNPLSGWK